MTTRTLPTSTPVGWRFPNAAAFLCALAGVVFIRAMVVSAFGTDMPYWDQWDAEIAMLYKPFMEGNLGFLDLFGAHNEHRIFFTRLFGLLLFGANEYQFDNMVESFANVILYAIVVGAFAAPFFRDLGPGSLFSAGVATALLGGLPYAWENVATGFQNAFYFMMLWTLAAVGMLAFGRRDRWSTVALVASAAFCGLFTLASGCLAAPAVAALAVLLYRSGELPLRQFVAIELTMLVIFALGLWLIPSTMHHTGLHSTGVKEFATVALTAMCWPLPAGWLALAGIWWPCFVWAWRSLRRNPVPIPRRDLFLLGIAGWAALQAFAIAASRGHDVSYLASRYVDTLVLGTAANLLLAASAVRSLSNEGRLKVALGAWVVFATAGFFVALAAWSAKGVSNLAVRAAHQRNGEINVAAFLAGDGRAALQGKHAFDISYPVEERVSGLLSDPSVQKMLPASISPGTRVEWPNCSLLATPGAYPTTPPPQTLAFGTYAPNVGNRNMGRCVSRPLQSTRSHVRIMTAGYLNRPKLSFELRSGSEDATVVLRRSLPDGEIWRPEGVALPTRSYVLVAVDDDPEFWFAFGVPVEQGRLSAFATDLAQLLRRVTQAP